ncbi:MAG: hypothetical protein JJT94_08860 [Bernardetiaceae bacterium]|nr:hypothetical protein [Bernardetiaceae bacterium]
MTALFFVGLVSNAGELLAQSEDDEDFHYESVFCYGINWNTNGGLIGGLSFRYQQAITKKTSHVFFFDMADIKHPKEQRAASPLTGELFVPAKRNLFYVLRPQYGRQFVLFEKAAERGVQVDFIIAAGPSIGIEAPYVIEYFDDSGLRRTRIEQYDPDLHPSYGNILGWAGLGESLAQAKFLIGAGARASFVFEYSTAKNTLFGLEAGYMVDAFTREIEIMAFAPNRAIYDGFFVTLFYGKGK